MSSGNPFGLSEISHFGSFQRVGGKAGGFINKKFFHPSSIRNQEKLWAAQTADERERRKQSEMEKRRDEERQVEDLRKQMYLAGQGSACAQSLLAEEDKANMSSIEKTDQKQAVDEQKRRRALLKKEHLDRELAGSPDPEGSPSPSPEDEDDEDDKEEDAETAVSRKRVLATSSLYNEDVSVRGHSGVWGSFWATEEKSWGFGCCKTLDRTVACPLSKEEEEEAKAKQEIDENKGSKRQRRRQKAEDRMLAAAEDAAGTEAGGAAASAGSEAAAASSANGAESTSAPATGSGSAGSAVPRQKASNASLMDNRMFEAAERRKVEKKKRDEEDRLEKERKKRESGYLGALLQDPSNKEQSA